MCPSEPLDGAAARGRAKRLEACKGHGGLVMMYLSASRAVYSASLKARIHLHFGRLPHLGRHEDYASGKSLLRERELDYT